MKTIKTFYLKTIIALFILFSLCSCETTKITDYLYIQDINVKGPINQPPVRVTGKDSASFTISPKFFINSNKSYNGLIEGHTKVNSEGFFEVDTITDGENVTYRETSGANRFDFEGENLHWSIPDYFVGLDLDISISRKVALSGGFTLSGKDKTNLYGYRVGLGFFSYQNNLEIRFDGGVIWQKYSYDAASVIIRDDGSADKEVFFYRDKGSSTNLNHYLSLTINTIYEDMPANFLINVGYSGQSLVDYEPREADEKYYIFDPSFDYDLEDQRGEAYTAFINVSPGIYINLNEWSRLVFAVRFFFELDFEESQNSTFIIPMAQFDLSL